MKKETRTIKSETRAAGDGRTLVSFLPYDVEADIGGFREVLRYGCCSKSIRAAMSGETTLYGLDSHDPSKTLCNTKNGTLRFKDTPEGLYIYMELEPEITRHKDLYLSAKRGDIGQVSFGFVPRPGGEEWEGDLRNLTDIEAFEFSVVLFAAYPQTSIQVRNKKMETKYNEQGERVVSAEEFRKYEEFMNQTINMPVADNGQQLRGGYDFSPTGNQNFNHIEQPDQPVYRGKFALGQQMMDIAAMCGAPVKSSTSEARSRWEQMVKREETRAAGDGQVQAVGTDGGFLLQGETSYELMTNGFNDSVVMSRTANRNLGNKQFVEILGIDETSRADGSRGGGIRVYSDAELDQLTSSKTKFQKTRLEPKRLTGLYYASNEILDNAPMLQAEMSEVFNYEFDFKGQDLIINGSGAGEPLGILNAGCLVSQEKDGAQSADTIVYDNITKMIARLQMRKRQSVVWLAHRNVQPELFKVSIPVGTGGSVVPVYKPSDDATNGVAGTLLGWPIVFIEQCADLGDKGDLILADLSQYIVATKGGVQADSSIHLKFDYHQTAFRFVYYMDGQPRLSSAITPYKGSTTVSPFVTLAAR